MFGHMETIKPNDSHYLIEGSRFFICLAMVDIRYGHNYNHENFLAERTLNYGRRYHGNRRR